MKKAFPTFVHESAQEIERIFVSAGKVGLQIELAPADLFKAANCKTAELICE